MDLGPLSRRGLRALLASPPLVRLPVGGLLVVALWLVANGAYQVARKPSELLFPVSGALHKTPSETWRHYRSSFRAHATSTMTPALLDRKVARTLARRRITRATLRQKQDLAAVIHLCGERVGDAYARRGFRLTARARCGDHDARGYLAQVRAMQRVFARL